MLISSNCFISTADAYGCKIEVNSDTALAKPNNQQQQGYSTYSCTPSSSSTQYEVHVLSVYEVINRRPPTAGNANVNIASRGQSNRPIVLVLGSYEPVNWILNLPAGISISKVILVSTFAHHELKEKKIIPLRDLSLRSFLLPTACQLRGKLFENILLLHFQNKTKK